MVALLGVGTAALPLLLTAWCSTSATWCWARRCGALRERAARPGRLAFFLVDETFGFAIAAGNAVEPAAVGRTTERTLLVAGLTLYVAWLAGHAGRRAGRRSHRGGERGRRDLPGAASSASPPSRPRAAPTWCARSPPPSSPPLVAWLLPGLRMLAPVVAGVLVALPGRER